MISSRPGQRDQHARDELAGREDRLLGAAMEAVDPHATGAVWADQFELGADDQEQAERVGDGRAVGDVADQRGGVADLRRAEPPGHRVDLGQGVARERLELGPGHVGADREDIPIAGDLPQVSEAGEAQEGRRLDALLVPLDAQLGAARDDDRARMPGLERDGVFQGARAEEDPPAGLDPERALAARDQFVVHLARRIEAR